MKKAFTLAEAVLTMTILGVIAAIMVTTLKPNQYRAQAYRTLKEKAYASVDEVTQTILTDCSINMNLATIYNNCNNKSTTANHAFGITEAATFGLYMRGTNAANGAAAAGCSAKAGYSNLKLRNGICLYFKAGEIFVDVNGTEGPNDTTDQFTITINNSEGVTSDMP